ncbi:uncharacterized protein LOC114130973 [Aphis gossypii]|uniref:uncharacterized protein LOC114130973 n=1 Tax=Aphis gossypii TaxID=80765 RepID=UPI00100E4709|nr:uncharacterized protein LOC114130973 [Aphis gossypii]XP_050063782.1 uncharacterized protein LOC114130973 [Aphis gossypii]XP_050063783.1 uncharacterized protein LOC114130973 [Aphis gossypii]XP_050063784.1 uncharacterized protein LOC114130973 [Aphis gossypii]
MKKVETYQQQQSPSPPLPQQQQQLPMPRLVANCVTTSDKLIKHDGEKSINEKTYVKWPVKRKVNRKEWRKRLNARMHRLVRPKSSLMVFSELFKDVQINLTKHSILSVISYTATLEIGGEIYYGNDISKTQAKEKACENFLRTMLAKKMSEQSEEKEESPMNVEREVGENGSVSKPKGHPQEDFPWPNFAALAMHNLMNQWNIQPVESTVIKPQPKTVGMRKFPENPKNCNPIQLLNQMKPGVKYIEAIAPEKLPLLFFQINCVIDDILFTGEGRTKKAAKKECCIAAIKYFWQFDFHAIENN